MNTIVVDYRNFQKEHLCCVLRDRNGEGRIDAKRNWLEKVFEDGLVLRKGAVNAKVFLEYIPAEFAWFPVEAPGYMFIHCYRMDPKYRHSDYETAIWREMIAECKIKGKKGLAVIVGKEDLPNLNRKEDFTERGFRVADFAEPYFELLYLPFAEDTEKPRLMDVANTGQIDDDGWVLYYTDQCPHNAKLVPALKAKGEEKGIKLKTIRLEKQKETGRLPWITCPYTTFALYHEGKFITHEMISPAKFAKYLDQAK